MKVDDVLRNITHLFLDTAPVIYYVEGHPQYAKLTGAIFDRIDKGEVTAVTSPVTLAECLVVAYRGDLQRVIEAFSDLIGEGSNTNFVIIGQSAARRAAQLRAKYNITLTDALQIAVALEAGCEAFLTNDSALRRVTELRVLVLDEIEAQQA